MCPLELTATPDTSPRYMLVGIFNRLGTESKAITGTFCCASAGEAASSDNPINQCFIVFFQAFVLLFDVDALPVRGEAARPSSEFFRDDRSDADPAGGRFSHFPLWNGITKTSSAG